MPDNNGNPIVNPMSYNAGNSDLNSSISDLRSLMLDLMSVVQSLGSAIRESSSNTEKTVRSYERITNKTTKDLKETISKNKEVFEHLLAQSLKNHEELQRKSDLGSENATKVIEALGSKFDEYKKIKENLIKIEEQYVSLNDVIEATTLKSRELTKQHSEVTDNIAKLQADNVNGKNDDILDEQYDLLDTLNNQISELNKSLIGYKDELADITDIKIRAETQTRNSKDYQYVSDVIDRAANANEKELGQIVEEIKDRDKREDRREKAKSAREFKIANELTECFDDGLFKLGTNLSDTFKKATNEHLKGTRGSLLGEIAAFAEKSLFSIMDYQTQKVTDAISSLQASFESTGMEISRAILVDRDEIAAEYQDVANELKAQGYDKALSVTDLVGYEAQIARAGITNEDLIHEIALEFGKVSAKTGVGLPDLLSDEILLNLQHINKTQGTEAVTETLQNLSNAIINGVSEVESATGISQGKSQETAIQYVRDVVKYGLEDATDKMQDTLSAQITMGQYSGGTDVFQRMITALESSRTQGVSDDLLSQMHGVFTREQYNAMVESGDYLGTLESMLKQVGNLSGEDATATMNTVLNWLGVNADEWAQLTDNGKNIDKLIEEIEETRSAMQQDGQSAEVQRREELVTAGRTLTVEQGLKNQALADTAGMWGEAVQTGIPEAANMLKDSIETANSGIQSAISWGVEKLVGVLTGGSIFSGLVGAGGGTGGIGSGIGATLGKGGPAVGLGPTITAALTSFAAGYGIGTAFDNLTGLSDIISDSIVGDVKGTQDAINNLKQVEEDNQAKNTMYQNTLQASIDDIKLSSEIIKQNLQDNISDISKGITDMRDSKEVVGKTVKSVMERGESFYDSKTGGQTTLAQLYQSTTGKDYTTASESDLASWYEKEDIQEHLKVAEADRVIEDITQAQQNASIDANRVARETARTMLSDAMSDGEISYFEYQEAEKNLAEFMAKAGLSAEEQKSFRNMMGQEYRQAYTSLNGYNAAKQVFEHIKSLTANLDISDATEKTNEIQRIAKAVKTNTYDDMGNITPEILALARPYMDLEGGYNEFTALTLKGNTDPYTMYLPENVTPLAVGIDYVPYDEFPALLHKGERVQTAAEARLEDLADSVYYDTVNNTVTNTSVDGLNTTNNSIKDGFNTTTDNQEIIIEALKIIVNALTTPTTSSNNNDVFESITNNKIALRSNNIARLTSYH